MRKLMLISVVTGALAAPLVPLPASGQEATGGGQKVEPAIAKVADAYMEAVNARDAARVAELYTEDAVEMPPHQKPVKGRAAIRNHYQQQFKGETAEFSDLKLQRMESRITGEIAYDTGQYSQRITPKAGKPVQDTGNYIVILHRTGGQWRVAYAIYNSHMLPLGTPATNKP